MNRLPSSGDCEEEARVSSPNSTISSLSGKRSERELANGEEHEIERDCSRGVSDEEDGETSRKKLRLSKDQSAILEDSFKEHNTLNPVSNMQQHSILTGPNLLRSSVSNYKKKQKKRRSECFFR